MVFDQPFPYSLDYVGVVEVLYFSQKSHFSNDELRDATLGVLGEVQSLHRYETLLIAPLSGFVHFPVGALADFCQEFII